MHEISQAPILRYLRLKLHLLMSPCSCPMHVPIQHNVMWKNVGNYKIEKF